MQPEPSSDRPQALDTSPGAERLLIDAWRNMEPWEKARRVSEISRACQQLALIGLRVRHPYADERELQLRLAALRLDRETMLKVFGWDPERRGY